MDTNRRETEQADCRRYTQIRVTRVVAGQCLYAVRLLFAFIRVQSRF
jgi:hypothetical protein